MADGWNITNTPNGLLFVKPPLGEQAQVKKAKWWGFPAKISSRKLDRKDLIKFINCRLEPTQAKVRTGCLGPSNKKLRSLLQNALKEKIIEVPEGEANTVADVIAKEPTFMDQLSPNQLILYHSFSRPQEKRLYEQLYSLGESEQYPGIIADVLLSLIKDRVISFQIKGNDITVDLIKGHGERKLLGFNLKGTFPEHLTLRYDPVMKRLSLLNCKIPFYYSLFYIMNPECMTLTSQGVFIQADFGKAAKASGEHKVLDKHLRSDEVFGLFK